MNFEYFDKQPEQPADSYFDRWPDRSSEITKIEKKVFWDVVIVGGGIHGASMAHLCALNGLATLLLERDDYASGTSSRSSKMAHGGLRYLEMFDFQQVLEGVRAREDLFEVAKHLVHPYRFFIPVGKDELWFRLKLGLGLKVYDRFVRDKERRHEYIRREGLSTAVAERLPECPGGFLYTDGVMDDSLLVLEHILAARQEGAICLNYASFESFARQHDDLIDFGWRDRLGGQSYQGRTGLVINCAGPWVPFAGRVKPSVLAKELRYSQGSHLLFPTQWKGPALFLPLEGRSRYYFIWPHFAGTMVGTTEREISEPILDPIPAHEEISEVFRRLNKDIAGEGFDRSDCHYAFAGVRTLPVRSGGGSVTRMSRKHRWVHQDGMLSLLGGKLTTAVWTAQEGLRQVFKLAGLKRSPVDITGRLLPGSALLSNSVQQFKSEAQALGISQEAIDTAVSRYGSRVRFFCEEKGLLDEVVPGVLRGEVKMAFIVDQAQTLEDFMRRRLGLEYTKGNGIEHLDSLIEAIQGFRPDLDLRQQKQDYISRMTKIHDAIQGSFTSGA